jgi:hypothetical protein
VAGTAADFIRDVSMISPNSTVPVNCLWHMVSNILIDLRGDEADVESFHLAMVIRTDGGQRTESLIGGRYLDRFTRVGGRWAIAHRDVVFDWSRVESPTVPYWAMVGMDPSKMMQGAFCADDPLYGRLNVKRGRVST